MARARTGDRATDGTVDEAPFPLFKESLSYQSQLLARLMQSDYLARIADTGIAPAQAYVLGELWLHDPQSQVELARRLDIGKATVGQTLIRLERAGLIERHRTARDRRRVMVHLTEKGRSMREPLRLAMVGQDALIERAVGRTTMDELADTLRRVNALLGDAMPRGLAD